MQFLADQDVYQVTVEWLRGEGHEVITARTLEMQRAADRVLLQRAREMGRLFLTRDKDFGALVFLEGARAPGVILLRITPTTVEAVHAELRRLLQEHEAEDLQELFCVIEPHRYRTRRIPRL